METAASTGRFDCILRFNLTYYFVRGSELACGGDPSDGHGRTGVGRPSRDSTQPVGPTPVDPEPTIYFYIHRHT
eukprot:2402655-Pleurochrysis_carterae.AAC.4